jgi:hypothetical protein
VMEAVAKDFPGAKIIQVIEHFSAMQFKIWTVECCSSFKILLTHFRYDKLGILSNESIRAKYYICGIINIQPQKSCEHNKAYILTFHMTGMKGHKASSE